MSSETREGSQRLQSANMSSEPSKPAAFRRDRVQSGGQEVCPVMLVVWTMRRMIIHSVSQSVTQPTSVECWVVPEDQRRAPPVICLQHPSPSKTASCEVGLQCSTHSSSAPLPRTPLTAWPARGRAAPQKTCSCQAPAS